MRRDRRGQAGTITRMSCARWPASRWRRPRGPSTTRPSSDSPKRLSYVAADAADPASYDPSARGAGRSDEARLLPGDAPVAVRPDRRGARAGGSSRRRAGRDRETVRIRPRVGPRAERTAPPGAPGGSDLPDRPLPGEGAGPGHRVPAVRERDPRTDLEPTPRGVGADHPRGVDRHRGPGRLLRRRGRVARRRPEPPAAGARPRHDGAAGGRQGRGGRSPPRRAPRDPRRRSGGLRPRAVRGVRGGRRRAAPDPTPRRSPPSDSASTTGVGPASRS